MSPAEGLKAILEDAGVVDGVSGWVSRIGGTSDVAQQLGFIDTGGRGGEVKVAIDYPTVQIIVQGSKAVGGYSAGFEKAREVYDTLQAIDPQAIWDELDSCVAMNQPIWIGRSDNDLPKWSLNFRLITSPNNIGNRDY